MNKFINLNYNLKTSTSYSSIVSLVKITATKNVYRNQGFNTWFATTIVVITLEFFEILCMLDYTLDWLWIKN